MSPERLVQAWRLTGSAEVLSQHVGGLLVYYLKCHVYTLEKGTKGEDQETPRIYQSKEEALARVEEFRRSLGDTFCITTEQKAAKRNRYWRHLTAEEISIYRKHGAEAIGAENNRMSESGGDDGSCNGTGKSRKGLALKRVIAKKGAPAAAVGIVRKRKRSKSYDSYESYIRKVLKQIHRGDVKISSAAITIMDTMMHDIFDRLTTEAVRFNAISGKKTLRARDYVAASRVLFPGQLARHAVSEGSKATGYKHLR